ncbi:MAG: hypothetical protein J6B81_02100 [Spirochaetaceae bacterium]|nr:hypothetical protein [Spirochaetaceae bacterium]
MTTQRNLATIEAEIKRTKDALANVQGTETEVYARIVGYYRSVRNWNKGKRDEYNHRKQFVYTGDEVYTPTDADTSCGCEHDVPVIKGAEVMQNGTSGAMTYEFYARRTCPNCPPVKEYLANTVVAGTFVDVDTESGLAKAAEKGVFSAPTVIVYDASTGQEIARAHSVTELSAVLEPAPVLC